LIRQIKRVAFVWIAVCSLLCGLATAADDHAQDRQQILQLEREWNHVYLVNDAGPLEHIIADDFLGTMPDGRRATKKDLIDEIKGPSNLASSHINEDDITIRYYGMTAIVNGSESWTQKDGKSGRYIWTDIFVKKDGRWQVVASQDLEVKGNK
jgi:hypothetical protein